MTLLAVVLGLCVDASAAPKARPIPLGERVLRSLESIEPDAKPDRVAVNQEGKLVYGVPYGKWVYTFEQATTTLVEGHAGPKVVAMLAKTELPTSRRKDVQRGMMELWLFEESGGKLRPVPDWNPVVLGEGYWPEGVSLSTQKIDTGDAVAFVCKYSAYDQMVKPRHKKTEGVLLYPLHGQFVEVFRTNLEDRYEDKETSLDYDQRSVWTWADLDHDGILEILIARMHKFSDEIDREELETKRKGSFEVYVWNPETAAKLDDTLRLRPRSPERYQRVQAIPDLSTATPQPRETEEVVVGHTYKPTDLSVYERRGWYLPRLNRWVLKDETSGVAVRGGRLPLLSMPYVPGAPLPQIRREYKALEPHPFTVVPYRYTVTGAAREEGASMQIRWEGKGVSLSFWVSDDKVLEALPFENVDVDEVEVGIAPELSPKNFGQPVRALLRLNRTDHHGGWYRLIPGEDTRAFKMRLFDLPSLDWTKKIPDQFPRVHPNRMACAAWMSPEQWGLAQPTVVPDLSLPHPDQPVEREETAVDTIYELFIPFHELGWGGIVPEFFRFYSVVVDVDTPGDRPHHLYPFPDDRSRLDCNDPSTWASAVVEY